MSYVCIISLLATWHSAIKGPVDKKNMNVYQTAQILCQSTQTNFSIQVNMWKTVNDIDKIYVHKFTIAK